MQQVHQQPAWSFADPVFNVATTTMLSDLHGTVQPCQCLPHNDNWDQHQYGHPPKTVATAVAAISHCSHKPSDVTAPQPYVADTFDVTVTDFFFFFLVFYAKLTIKKGYSQSHSQGLVQDLENKMKSN